MDLQWDDLTAGQATVPRCSVDTLILNPATEHQPLVDIRLAAWAEET